MSDICGPVLIGEVLFDVFPGGKAVAGGAPFNVAWHLQGLGERPLFISRVGEDEHGEKIVNMMQQWGMDTSFIQTDSDYPTGIVDIAMDDKQHTFEICDDVAYDHIELAVIDRKMAGDTISFLYHGSLCARHEKVYDTILQLRQAAMNSFVDINLRPPWWERQKLEKLICGANWLKLNDEELIVLTGTAPVLDEMLSAAKSLMREAELDSLILTRGEQGALIVQDDKVYQAKPCAVQSVVDTVGAGDAFSAVCILGLMHNWDLITMLERAGDFAASICKQRGAITPDRDFYDVFRNKWKMT